MERLTKGIWIPIEIWEDKNLSWNERILFLEIDSFTSVDKDCFISNEYIANLLNVSETSANKILSSLIKKGYVIKTSFDGRKKYVKSALHLTTTLPCTLEQPCLELSDNILNTVTNTITKEEDTNVSKKVRNIIRQEDVDYLYSLYPPKCPNRNKSNGKGIKDKEKIKSLLGSMPKEELEFTIKAYVQQCTENKEWMKNLSTFLNNLPDMGYCKEEEQQQEIRSSRKIEWQT